jgi:hypothetical protein
MNLLDAFFSAYPFSTRCSNCKKKLKPVIPGAIIIKPIMLLIYIAMTAPVIILRHADPTWLIILLLIVWIVLWLFFQLFWAITTFNLGSFTYRE